MSGDGAGESAAGSGSGSAYDRVTRALNPPLLVVTAADGARRDGCVVGFHSQCSLDPPRHAVWLSRANRTYRVALGSGYLGVHFLGSDDRELGEWFGGHTGDTEDPFAGVRVDPGHGGVPLLRDVSARFVGRCVEVHDDDEGDHVCFVVEPVSGDASGPVHGDGPLGVADLSGLEPGHPG